MFRYEASSPFTTMGRNNSTTVESSASSYKVQRGRRLRGKHFTFPTQNVFLQLQQGADLRENGFPNRCERMIHCLTYALSFIRLNTIKRRLMK